MDIVPETPVSRKTVETGIHNLETSGVQRSAPETVVAGDAPAGAAFYDAVTDTVYLGPQVMGQREIYRQVLFEHEQIHAEQYRLLMGEPGFAAAEVESLGKEAMNRGLEIGEQFVDDILFDGRLWAKNAPIVFGLATGDEEIVETVEDAYYGMLEVSEPEVEGGFGAVERAYRGSEEWLFQELSDIEASLQSFMPKIARETDDRVYGRWKEYEETEFPDHIMEGATQFWQLFRLETGKLVEDRGRDAVQNLLEKIDENYTGHPLYSRGGEIASETERYISEFQEKLGRMEPYDAAAEVVNQSYDELVETI